MRFRDRVRSGTPTARAGFQLVRPPLQRFTHVDGMLHEVNEQAENVVLVDGSVLTNVDVDGRIIGSGPGQDEDFQLSQAAFGDLCHFCKIPVSFIKRRAKMNEALALEIVRDCLAHEFLHGNDRQLVVDVRTNRVDGIVGKDTYSPIGNANVLEYAMTAMPDLEFASGWLEGPSMRATAVSPKLTFESPAKKGDIVKFGVDVRNAINGDGSVSVADYNERLVCTNGMVARDKEHCEHVVHRGDVKFNVQSAVVRAAGRSPKISAIMQASATTLLGPSDVRSIRAWLREPRNGGTPSLDEKVTEMAMRGALEEGRDQTEVTLWNYVNGVTEAAHDTASLNRRTELEALGYRTLNRFGVALAAT